MNEAILSRWVHAKNNANISEHEFSKILDNALLNFGHRCLISYSRSYAENPKALLDSFMKYNSIKMAAQYVIKYARKEGILEELDGKKSFEEWANKQPLEDKWKPVLAKLLLVIWGVLKE